MPAELYYSLSQFGTVPLSCHAEEFQLETEISISAPNEIVEVADGLDFSSLVKLTLKRDPTDESPRILTDMTSSPALSNYQETTSAEIADHMELALEGKFQIFSSHFIEFSETLIFIEIE